MNQLDPSAGTFGLCSLSEREEELLLTYLDGEAGFFTARRARRLLVASSGARQFAHSILALKEQVGEWHHLAQAKNAKCDLWSRIERRIDQEEHAALFLGGREFVSRLREQANSGKSWLEKILGPGAWSTAGALVAASLTMFMIQPTTEPAKAPQLREENPVSNVTDVSFETGSRNFSDSVSTQRGIDRQVYRRAKLRESARLESTTAPRILPSELNQLTQVDWMRSDGQLLFVQAPRPGSTIIWVKRPKSQVQPSRDPALGRRPVILDREQDIISPAGR